MKNFIKKITGLDKEQEKLDADKKELAKQEEELLSKRDPKAYATRKKQPWVGVLDVKVNEKNVRNGFFELDWNKYFIEQLINAGYGVANDPEEEIVDRWFQTVCRNVAQETYEQFQADPDNRTNLGNGYTEVK